MNENKSKPVSPEESAANALNEQGFLFSQVVRDSIRNQLATDSELKKHCEIVACEYPVTAINGDQTRIDHVLKFGSYHLVIECKRANPTYKRWLFFDKEVATISQKTTFFYETANDGGRTYENKAAHPNHNIQQKVISSEIPVFNSYLETAYKKDKKWSASDTIEEAFRQVMRGQSGLVTKLISFDSTDRFQIIPIVVTSAELFDADFDPSTVSLRDGCINPKDLKLSSMEFCGINYHADDDLSARSCWINSKPTNLQHDLGSYQRRTVFVVQAEAISKFLTIAKKHLPIN